MDKYTFYKTNRSFFSFTALRNHINSYAKKNSLDLNNLLKENYDYYCSLEDKTCIYCKKPCVYNGYHKGYKNPCFSPECYKNFVDNNIEYYSKQLGLSYFDLYDNSNYGCAFSKRYFDITNEYITENQKFFVDKRCENCDVLIGNVSVFSSHIRGKTCSKTCKHKLIGDKKRKSSIFIVDDFDGNKNLLNHYIFENRKYPISKDVVTNKSLREDYKNIPHLRIPSEKSRIHYSSKYDLYFYSSPGTRHNSLYEFLGSSDEEYLNYHVENSLGKHSCPGCNRNILFTDVFGFKIIENKYCSKNCYYNTLIGSKLPEKQKESQSKTLKMKILNGEFTPNITNSWCRSKTKIFIFGEEKFVRSSWEAVFWSLNPSLSYEKIRIPYVDKHGKSRTYIVDFYCNETSTLYEIKPKSEQTTTNNLLKEEAAKLYCQQNGMNYFIIDENYFNGQMKEITSSDILNYISEDYREKFFRGIGWTAAKLH